MKDNRTALWQRVTHYCVIKDLNMLQLHHYMHHISARFSSISEALASELLENIEEILNCYNYKLV